MAENSSHPLCGWSLNPGRFEKMTLKYGNEYREDLKALKPSIYAGGKKKEGAWGIHTGNIKSKPLRKAASIVSQK